MAAFVPTLPARGRLSRSRPALSVRARPNPASHGYRRVVCCAPASAPTSAPTSGASSAPTRTVLDVLRERGLFDAATADDDVLRPLLSSPVSVYTGFDPTADSLHLGNLLALIALSWFQRMGHTVVAVVGGATGRIGDPSGKSAERPVLSETTIAENLAGIDANIRGVLSRSAQAARDSGQTPGEVVVLNNHDWTAQISFLDFLRDVGKYARVNTMLNKDSVRTRLDSEDGMSFTEFTYQLLQAHDFLYLNDNHQVSFQLGGSDQWGNITAGTELTRKLRSLPVHGITFPLLTTSDGRKFGKSEKGAVWLSADKLSPYEFYQHLFKTPDADVVRFLKRLTFLPLDQIDGIEADMASPDYVANTAQKLLAEEVTRLVHGDGGVQSALAATAAAAPGSRAKLSAESLEAIAGDMPSVTVDRDEAVGMLVIDLMVHGGLQKSKGEARRLVKNGGAYLNNNKVQDATLAVTEADLIDGQLLLLAAGKKNKLLVRVQ